MNVHDFNEALDELVEVAVRDHLHPNHVENALEDKLETVRDDEWRSRTYPGRREE